MLKALPLYQTQNMQKTKILTGGYIGLIALLISVALISLFIMRTDLFSGGKNSKNSLEQGQEAIKEANTIKDILESNNKLIVYE